jgi:uncharacterized protein YbjT (DUF2867 family)
MNIVMLGATGAVGSEALKSLLAMPQIARVTAITRRSLDLAHPKLHVQVADVFSPSSYASVLNGHDGAICTFGVGQPSKVPPAEFLRVDKDAVMAFASACKMADVKHFELLGSVAADPASRSFYLKSKGDLREAIAALKFARFSCFQPSMLITPDNRYDWVQGIMLAVWPVLSPLLIGPLQKYRGIAVAELGRAMARNLLSPGSAVEILHWPAIKTLAA